MTAGDSGSIQTSAAESVRFGLHIGRWTPTFAEAVRELPAGSLAPYDVVIVRQPAEWAERWVDLMQFDEHVALHADTLVYWSWRDAGEQLPSVSGAVDHHADATGLAALVRDVFDQYQNHYASNPLLSRAAALEGYVEWAERTAADAGGYLSVDDEQGPFGFAVVDWNAPAPDVRLAGLCRRARGEGRYRDVAVAMMELARRRGATEIAISTQVQNVAVQRTWASLGWRPTGAFDTTHLVRRALLVDTGSTSRDAP